MRAGIRKYVALFCRVFASSPRRVRVNPLAACREPSPPKVSNREHLVFILGLAIYISERILAAKKIRPRRHFRESKGTFDENEFTKWQ
jgi:hypothetical protein